MFESFTGKVIINAEEWALHFSFDSNELRYVVRAVSRGSRESFTMAMISHYYWKIITGCTTEMKATEHCLNELIQQNNAHLHLQATV